MRVLPVHRVAVQRVAVLARGVAHHAQQHLAGCLRGVLQLVPAAHGGGQRAGAGRVRGESRGRAWRRRRVQSARGGEQRVLLERADVGLRGGHDVPGALRRCRRGVFGGFESL